MGACSTLAPANSHVDSCTSPISFGLCLTQNLQHVPAFSRMRSKGFPFIVWGSGGWTLVRLKWLVASSSRRRRVVYSVSMGEAAKPLLFEGFQTGCHVVLRGRRGTL